MTDPATIAVAVAALAVLGIVTVLSMPRPPTLDGERWFKAWLATLLRGSAEAAGGTAEEWAAAVVRFVVAHPGRRHLDDQISLADRLQDPALLGDKYDPARWIGPNASWSHIAQGMAGPLPAALAQGSNATWVFVGEPVSTAVPDLVAPLSALLGERALRWSQDSSPITPQLEALRDEITDRRDAAVAETTLHLLTTLHELAPGYADNLVLVGLGDGMHLILEALRTSAPLRDQTQAVLSLGGRIGGDPTRSDALGSAACEAWLDAHFNHDSLDLEAAHRTPYMALQWLDDNADPPGITGLTLGRARFPTPLDRVDGKAVRQRSMEAVDLGVLPVDDGLPTDLVALAVCGTVQAWVNAAQG